MLSLKRVGVFQASISSPLSSRLQRVDVINLISRSLVAHKPAVLANPNLHAILTMSFTIKDTVLVVREEVVPRQLHIYDLTAH